VPPATVACESRLFLSYTIDVIPGIAVWLPARSYEYPEELMRFVVGSTLSVFVGAPPEPVSVSRLPNPSYVNVWLHEGGVPVLFA